jgi:Protein of unknown function (DUF2970)
MSIWRTFSAVAWSFLGVRKASEFDKDIAQTSPLHIIAVGFIATLVFVGALIVLVNWVVAR